MECLVPDSGYKTISIDLSAGEPTVTAHYSQDKAYRYATFDGVGKAPHYENGVLMISDIYLMTMSVSPIGAEKIYQAFKSVKFDEGRSFAEQWLVNDEVVKGYFKKDRQLHKMLALGLGYGMGPKKMCKQAFDNGHILELKTSRDFFRAYWDLFYGVRRLADNLAKQIETRGFIVNAFGYRLTPPPHKGFNYLIQSTVSGIMHAFVAKLMSLAPYAYFITVIHDELVADVPFDRIEDFRIAKDRATESLNKELGWSVNIRTGFAIGSNWYEAK